ncbi:MAG: C25 family cysteine peptidase [Candidatus Eisenbacteria bacterium]
MKPHPLFPAALLFAALLLATSGFAVTHTYTDGWADAGLHVTGQGVAGVDLTFSLTVWDQGEMELEGRSMQTVGVPGLPLPGEAGAPNLPGMSRFIAVPNGAEVYVRIVDSRTETYADVEIAPAPRIPRETEDGPLEYPRNQSIYDSDEFYPGAPVTLSAPRFVRGVESRMLGIAPFQYNPVTRELVVYRDLRVEVTFEGGTGVFAEERLRNRWWEPILADLFANYESIGKAPPAPRSDSRTDDFEYVIICPDDPAFVAWADSLKRWRTEQGIRTGVVTTADIGGNTIPAIESYLNNAYMTWSIPPSAALLLGDYGTTGARITSPIWSSYCLSDNIFADVDGDDLPDIVLARITAQNEADLANMIGKMLGYERQPPTAADFYSSPIMAGGWQTERWFILCEEVLYGYFANVLGKNPVREYAIYSGTPGSVWSTATNTATVVNYFGPNGLGYIPQTPAHLTDWGGNATRINSDINRGSFMLQHRDHGANDGWGEPYYVTGHLSALSNDELTFVFSVNCLTGQFNLTGNSFAEAFHHHARGALGIIAATEVSYSFVNDAYVWGMYDYMWPDFDPGYGIPGPAQVLPAFANASGKYYLEASSWPYNTTEKTVTYHLFHHHGDAFMTVYSEVPENLTVSHDGALLSGMDYFTVTADGGSWIGLSAGGEFLGAASGTGSPVNITIPPLVSGEELLVTVTKQDHYRYEHAVTVVPPDGPFLIYEGHSIADGGGDNDGAADEGETIDLEVTLENVGTETAIGVIGVLSTADPHVTIIEDNESFDDIPAGGFGTTLSPFVVEIHGDAPDGHSAEFLLSIAIGDSVREASFSVPIDAPLFTVAGLLIDDIFGGDGNGNVNAGETVNFEVVLANEGHSDAEITSAVLTSTEGDVTILGGDGECGALPVSGTGWMGTFSASVAVGCPEPANLAFHLEVTAENGFVSSLDFDMPVGGWFDDMEEYRAWSVGAPDDDASSGIWARLDPIGTLQDGHPIQPEDDHTPGAGTHCYVTGNGTIGGTAGENDVDGGKTTLFTPVFDLSDAVGATIGYWRWYSNSWGNDPDNDWWDVDATADGMSWESLEHTSQTIAAWTEQTFDLAAYVPLTDQVQIRFVASDEGSGSLVEAGVDDFILAAVRVVYTDVEGAESGPPAKLALGMNTPNPFNPTTTIHFDLPKPAVVELSIYDITGRRVATLVSGKLEAGRHEAVWTGRGVDGQAAGSGLYFSRLKADGETKTRKMLLLK